MEIDDILAEVLESKKYGRVDASVARRICADAARKHPKKRDAVKAAKNALHVIHGSFLGQDCHRKALALVAQCAPGFDRAQMESNAEQILRLHMSTNERVGDIRAICSFLGESITGNSAVMDIGCGFSPFALPFLPELPREYIAYDISADTVDLLNAYFARAGFASYRAEILDAVATTPDRAVDVVLLFKILPLLHQQKKGRGFDLLNALRFKTAIVSFPLKSLTDKQKGMGPFYTSWMEKNLPPALSIVDKRSFSNEMFFLVERV